MFEGRKVMDIRLRLAENIVNIRYGVSADQERSRVMKHVAQDLTRRVWRREQDIVSGALPGKHATSVIKNKNCIDPNLACGPIQYSKRLFKLPPHGNCDGCILITSLPYR